MEIQRSLHRGGQSADDHPDVHPYPHGNAFCDRNPPASTDADANGRPVGNADADGYRIHAASDVHRPS